MNKNKKINKPKKEKNNLIITNPNNQTINQTITQANTKLNTKLNTELISEFINCAILEAKKSLVLDVPIGAIIIYENKIIGRGHNEVKKKNNSLKHAEIIAINNALKKIDTERLNNADMFVTLEPCLMCFGAIVLSKIRNVYVGARSKKTGVFSSGNINYKDYVEKKIKLNHRPNFIFVDDKDCEKMVKEFFVDKR